MTYLPNHHMTAAQIKAWHRGTVQLKVSQLAIWLTVWAEAHQRDESLMRLYKPAADWLKKCMKACGAGEKERVAAPVKKRAGIEIQTIESIRIAAIGNVPLSASAWGAWWVYFDAIVSDVVRCWEGGKTQCWSSLEAAVDAITRAMLDRNGEGESLGAEIFERAMEATRWE